jgi:hypothetical protein
MEIIKTLFPIAYSLWPIPYCLFPIPYPHRIKRCKRPDSMGVIDVLLDL